MLKVVGIDIKLFEDFEEYFMFCVLLRNTDIMNRAAQNYFYSLIYVQNSSKSAVQMQMNADAHITFTNSCCYRS